MECSDSLAVLSIPVTASTLVLATLCALWQFPMARSPREAEQSCAVIITGSLAAGCSRAAVGLEAPNIPVYLWLKNSKHETLHGWLFKQDALLYVFSFLCPSYALLVG